ncbi:LysR family transcriptional regulator [Pseudomonas putida]|uniref:LysR family transcriptional regulator n=1 Tax=Pseudomonas putida TaxID=303 RepID=UPI0022DE272B|nr:LysR family transcriptional regulator [Pseudomonas putida]WBM49549.1 LysR family transcriptional regulator [Pseudomonas putida]
MDQFHLMQVFVAVGEQRSFAAAARLLDISPAAVTRAISALESHLGVQLLERSTRHLRLTETGQSHLENCRPILENVRQANEAVANANAEPSGNLSVTAPTMFGKSLVMPCVFAFMATYPKVDVSAFFKDRLVNLLDEGIDVAVRIGDLPDSGMKALRVGSTRKVLCASPDYLAHHGTPRDPYELRNHAVIASSNVSPRVDWKFDSADIRLKPRFIATSNDVAAMAAEAGIGIARFHYYQVVDKVESGRLKIILADFEEPDRPIHIVHRESQLGSTKVRSFIDMLANHLRHHPGVT